MRRKVKLLFKMKKYRECEEAIKLCIAIQTPSKIFDQDDELY